MIVPNNKSYGKHIRKKLLPEYYEAVKRRVKTFELRRDEDDIQPGDVLELYEWDGERYTGHKLTREVTYVLRNCPQYGLEDGYCIIGIMPIGWDTPCTVPASAIQEHVGKNMNGGFDTIDRIKSIMRRLLIVHDNVKKGTFKPVKNTSRHDCYRALYEIQSILETNVFRLDFYNRGEGENAQ